MIFIAKHVNLGDLATGKVINNFRNFSGMISSNLGVGGGGVVEKRIRQ